MLIETGANQAYIFDTNRLRHVVGASHLVHEMGSRWAPDAAAKHGADVVQAISGKALLLVDDPEAGRAVIGEVSARALDEAPGLEVTGVVGPPFDPALAWRPAEGGDADAGGGPDELATHVCALRRTRELLDLARAERPSPLLRDPMLPWFEVCRESGLPVAGYEPRPEDEGPASASASVLAKDKARGQAQRRMRGLLKFVPEVVPGNADDLGNDGWIAVLHADGNGVGQIFTDFPRRALEASTAEGDLAPGLTLEQHKDRLREFTGQLELATETALDLAVRDATSGQDRRGLVLPVVVGGDDVTVVCHARFALDLARCFALAFEAQTRDQDPTLEKITEGGLTAAVGIAYVKPHHPFSAAYELAEELTASAKRVKRVGDREVSAVDFHVAFESTLAPLATLRGRVAADGLARHGGPYVISGDDPVGGQRDIAELRAAMGTVAALSSSMAHDLREGLAQGEAEYRRRLKLAALSPDLTEERREEVRRLAPVRIDGEPVVRLLDALLLNAIAKPGRSAGAGDLPPGGSEPELAVAAPEAGA